MFKLQISYSKLYGEYLTNLCTGYGQKEAESLSHLEHFCWYQSLSLLFQHSWISWCTELSFWVALERYEVCNYDYFCCHGSVILWVASDVSPIMQHIVRECSDKGSSRTILWSEAQGIWSHYPLVTQAITSRRSWLRSWAASLSHLPRSVSICSQSGRPRQCQTLKSAARPTSSTSWII